MKERRVYRGIVVTAVAAMSLMLVTHAASAAVSNPRLARNYIAWLARAMDTCASVVPDGPGPVVSVLLPTNVPGAGCLQQNVATEGTLGMNLGRIWISDRGRIGLFATGFTLGDSLRVRLTLRVTRVVASVKHPLASNQKVTFVDQTIDCPAAGSFLARANGAVVGSTDLGACLAPYGGLAQASTGRTNIEILDAGLVNTANGKLVGHAGVIH